MMEKNNILITCDDLLKEDKYVSLLHLDGINYKSYDAFRDIIKNKNGISNSTGWRLGCVNNSEANPSKIVCVVSEASLLSIDEKSLSKLSMKTLNNNLSNGNLWQNSKLGDYSIHTNNKFTLRAICLYIHELVDKMFAAKITLFKRIFETNGDEKTIKSVCETFFNFSSFDSCMLFLLLYNKFITVACKSFSVINLNDIFINDRHLDINKSVAVPVYTERLSKLKTYTHDLIGRQMEAIGLCSSFDYKIRSHFLLLLFKDIFPLDKLEKKKDFIFTFVNYKAFLCNSYIYRNNRYTL